ncbi:MAG: carbohydrate binding domain-containing protein [Fimbriimonadaceae bacterium]|nr:carbohydrate binding domain-containing protein [Fimbriimonadaceae bacterium]
MMRQTHALLGLLLCLRVATGQDNLLRNPGFESVAEGVAAAGWQVPSYWIGSALRLPAAQAHSGQAALELRAATQDGKHWGRLLGSQTAVQPGLRYRFAAWVQGQGTFKLAIIRYHAGQTGSAAYSYLWQDPQPLSADWREVVLEYLVEQPDVRTVALAYQVEGLDTAARIDDGSFAVVRRRAGSVALQPGYQMLPAGQTAELRVAAAGSSQVLLLQSPSNPAGATETAVPTGQPLALTAGAATVRVAATALGLQRVDVVDGDLGAVASSFVDVVEPGEYAAFEAAAAAARLAERPAHLLFLGDSLTDFLRGRNYVDMVGYWLQRAHGPAVSVQNAGIGGDTIVRIRQRLAGEPTVHRLADYRDLFATPPTRAYVFVGHNDTKLSSGSGYRDPYVSLPDFEAGLRAVVPTLRAAGAAQITLLSSTASLFEVCEANAAKTVAAGRGASLFGKPEVLETYNRAAAAVAQETACRWLDVYTPTRQHAARAELFWPDGVHLTVAGNRLVALAVLRSLASP